MFKKSNSTYSLVPLSFGEFLRFLVTLAWFYLFVLVCSSLTFVLLPIFSKVLLVFFFFNFRVPCSFGRKLVIGDVGNRHSTLKGGKNFFLISVFLIMLCRIRWMRLAILYLFLFSKMMTMMLVKRWWLSSQINLLFMWKSF